MANQDAELRKWWTEDSLPDIRERDARRTTIRPPRDDPWEYIDGSEKTSGNGELDKFIGAKKLKWIPYNKLTNVNEIDKGGFGTIYKATLSGNNIEMKVALKSLNIIPHKDLDTFLKEWNYHADCLESYQIVNFLGFTEDQNKKEGQINYMAVMEYADNGTLYSNLEKISKCSWKQKSYILYKIATGLSFMHSKNLIHRDLHHKNILFNNCNDFVLGGLGGDDDVMITDLGLCQSINSVLASKGKEKKIYGILEFIAPEVLNGKDYTEASDVYSFSIIMWELTSGVAPGNIGIGKHPEILENTPECYKKLMEDCWNRDPSERPKSIDVANKIFSWITCSDNANAAKEFKDAKEIKYEKNNSSRSNSSPGGQVISLKSKHSTKEVEFDIMALDKLLKEGN